MPSVLRSISQLAQCPPSSDQSEIGVITDAAVAWRDGTIEWVGKESDLPAEYQDWKAYDAEGAIVIPGLIDCHTHLTFGGWRADEFEMRLLGKSYLEIAKAGGGILSTVRATREATREELFERGDRSLQAMAALGVTTVECKSGYGLDEQTELRLLEVYKELSTHQPVRLISTYLGAHTVPPEHKDSRVAYLDIVTEKVLPVVAERGLAQFCDVFIEDSAFSLEEGRRVLSKAKALGLGTKIHADQLTDTGGAALAAELEAASADHLERISDEGITALAESDVVGVMLPLASLYTQQPPLNARTLLERGVSLAVATDFNPGSAPSYHLPLAMMLACTMNRMTPVEVLKGATINAAKAIGVEAETGSLEAGKCADFALLQTPSINHWMYQFQANACQAAIRAGELIAGKLSRERETPQ